MYLWTHAYGIRMAQRLVRILVDISQCRLGAVRCDVRVARWYATRSLEKSLKQTTKLPEYTYKFFSLSFGVFSPTFLRFNSRQILWKFSNLLSGLWKYFEILYIGTYLLDFICLSEFSCSTENSSQYRNIFNVLPQFFLWKTTFTYLETHKHDIIMTMLLITRKI